MDKDRVKILQEGVSDIFNIYLKHEECDQRIDRVDKMHTVDGISSQLL